MANTNHKMEPTVLTIDISDLLLSVFDTSLPVIYHLCLQAVAEKDLGNTAYKKKDFETAMKHYNKAVDLDSTNIIFRNNKAGGPFSVIFTLCYEQVFLHCYDAVI